MKHYFIIVFIIAISLSDLFAQSPRPNEVVFGLGATIPNEKDPLNVRNHDEMPISLIGNCGYRRYIADLAAIGIRAFGTVNTLSDYTITTTSNPTPRKTEFSLTTINVGLEGIILLADEGHTVPYLSLMVLYSTGVLTNKELGKLNYKGVSFGIGLGLRIDLSKTTALSLEGAGCFGKAKWERKPFSNSSGDEYNPSTVLLTASIWFSFK